MNKFLLCSVCVLFLLSCENEEQYNNYGEPLSDAHVLESTEFNTIMEQTDSAKVKVEAKIIETCSKKGCWMLVDLGDGKEMRVTFKDYGFFVPKEGVEGQIVVMEGVAQKKTTDVTTLKHFAEDAGKSEQEVASITSPKEELAFVATGVAIKDSQE